MTIAFVQALQCRGGLIGESDPHLEGIGLAPVRTAPVVTHGASAKQNGAIATARSREPRDKSIILTTKPWSLLNQSKAALPDPPQLISLVVKRSSPPVLDDEQHDQAKESCREIVQHDAPAAGQRLQFPDGPRLGDVEEAEERKG